METTVIGSVPYLNARPLVRWFGDTDEGRECGVRVVEAVPSRLAQMREAGEIAAALVSSIELFRAPGLCYAPGIAVAAEGPVLSVRLLSRVPLEEIHSVALDTSSLTSVALLKILLWERFALRPDFLSAPPNLPAMLAEADAALLIGDLGYREYDSSLHALDLGAAWQEMTGLPFVYALWIGVPQALTPELVALLQRAKEWGTQNLLRIAQTEQQRLGETEARTRHYLTRIMRYTLGAKEEAALRLFGQKARENGLVEREAVTLRCGDPL